MRIFDRINVLHVKGVKLIPLRPETKIERATERNLILILYVYASNVL